MIVTFRTAYDGAVWWWASDMDAGVSSVGRTRREALRQFEREHPAWLRAQMREVSP